MKRKDTKGKRRNGLKILFRYYKRHWIFLAVYFLILLMRAVMAFFDAMFIARTISCIMDTGDYTSAIINAGISLALTVTSVLLGNVNTYFFKQLENRSKIDIQQQVLKSALEIQMSEYDTMGSGMIVTRLTADIDQLSTAFKELTTGIVEVLKKIAYIAYIFALNVWLGLFLIGMILISTLVYAIRVYYLKKLKPGVNNAAEKVNSKIIEVIRGVKDIKTLNCADNTLGVLRVDQNVYKKRDDHEWCVVSFLVLLPVFVVCFFIFLFFCVCVE